MKVKDILIEIKTIERLQNKLNNKEEFNAIDWKDLAGILCEYIFILGNKEIKDDEN